MIVAAGSESGATGDDSNGAASIGPGSKPIAAFGTVSEFADWLERNHADHPGIWMKIAKKDSPARTINYEQALDVALAYGWIDGQKRSFDADFFLQSFTQRRARSIWSKRNVDKVTAMIEAGTMRPSGLAQVEAAKADGRWDRAYAGSADAEQLPDFLAALEANPAAKEFYESLSSSNKYAIYFRIHGLKREDSRASAIVRFVDMLERHETLH